MDIITVQSSEINISDRNETLLQHVNVLCPAVFGANFVWCAQHVMMLAQNKSSPT